MNNHLEDIRKNLKQFADSEYQKYGYIPEKTEAKELKSNIKEKEMEIEANKLNGKMNNIIRKKEFKSGKVIDKSINNAYVMDNMSDNFNVIDNNDDYIDWRKLSIEDKLIVLEEYFNSENSDYDIDFDDNIKDELRKLVNEKKLLYKKDILYDKINKKILIIPLLKIEDNKFVLKEDVKKINIKKTNLNSINKLLKKN